MCVPTPTHFHISGCCAILQRSIFEFVRNHINAYGRYYTTEVLALLRIPPCDAASTHMDALLLDKLHDYMQCMYDFLPGPQGGVCLLDQQRSHYFAAYLWRVYGRAGSKVG